MKLKRLSFKIIFIEVILMAIFIFANFILIESVIERNVKFTSEIQSEQISKRVKEKIDILKKINENIAQNSEIIKVLENNKNSNDLDKNDINHITKQINAVENVLDKLSFANTINIVSLEGEYLLSRGEIYKDFKLDERPWFKEEYLKKSSETIVSGIHQDYSTKKYTIAIISYIYSEEDGSLIGAAVLDIFICDMLNFLETSFTEGKMKAYIKDFEGNIYLENNTIVDDFPIIKDDTNYYHVEKESQSLGINNNIGFLFDKSSIRNNEFLYSIYKEIKLQFFIIGIAIILSIIITIEVTFKPAVIAIEKLKKILNGFKDDTYNGDNGTDFKQLQRISDSLEKSIDDKIEELIYYDDLTKLPNRKGLKFICDNMIKNKSSFAVVFIDLNKFKYVNDRYGHLVGDELLIKFSNIIKSKVGDRAVLTRYSGDEFILVYKDFKCEGELREFYNKNIKSPFKNPIFINKDLKFSIGFSAGVAIFPRDGSTYADLIGKSDLVMYKNKEEKIDEISFFNEEMLEISILKSELENAISNNEFVLNYQPIIDKDKNIKKAEALLRWYSSKLGFVPPDRFIRYAEETRSIIDIGYWIIETVCKDLSDLNKSGNHIVISINVSPIQIMERDFICKVKSIIEKYNISYNQLCFEITETVVLDENSLVVDNILKLNQLGIKIALDDFGTGYSSFSYLKKYDLDLIKLDKMFLKNNDYKDYKTVKSIKDIAHTLGMKIVIEGVETNEQFTKLCEIDCDFLQGYYFSKPLKLEDFKELLN